MSIGKLELRRGFIEAGVDSDDPEAIERYLIANVGNSVDCLRLEGEQDKDGKWRFRVVQIQ
jgi:hypothetical protein